MSSTKNSSLSISIGILSCYRTDDPTKVCCPIPSGLYVEDKSSIILPNAIADNTIIPLTWVNDYDILYMGEVICRLRTRRQWGVIWVATA